VNGRIDPRQGHGENEIRAFADIAAAAGAALMLEFVASCRADPVEELTAFAAALGRSGARPESVAVAPAEDRIRGEPGAPPPPLALLGAVYRAARAALPDRVIGGGTFAFFTELNRNWPPLGLVDYVTHMVSSVVHAADDRSMIENLESFRHIRATVQAFAGTMPHRIVAMNIGLDVGAGDPAPNPDNLRVPMARRDPRQRGLFGGAWTLGAMAELAPGGIDAVTLGALAGAFALVDGTSLHPIYHVVAGMAAAAGKRVIRVNGLAPRRIAGLAHETPDGARLWLANLTAEPQTVTLPKAVARSAVLDETTFGAAAGDPEFLRHAALPAGRDLEIGAYGVVCIESGR
jgi:hypothetical protein